VIRVVKSIDTSWYSNTSAESRNNLANVWFGICLSSSSATLFFILNILVGFPLEFYLIGPCVLISIFVGWVLSSVIDYEFQWPHRWAEPAEKLKVSILFITPIGIFTIPTAITFSALRFMARLFMSSYHNLRNYTA